MNKRTAFASALFAALALLAGGVYSAPRDGRAIASTALMTCPAMLLDPIHTVEVDWLLSGGQGWLEHGEVFQTPAGPSFRCYYGYDKADPTRSPAWYIHKAIPAGNTNCFADGPKGTILSCPTAAPGR